MSFTDFLDSAITTLSPQRGMRRRAARQRLKIAELIAQRQITKLKHHWEAADDDRARARTWANSNLSPDSAQEQDLETVRSRSREMYRSNPHAASLIDGRANNIVGRNIRPQPRISKTDTATSTGAVKISDEQAKRYNAQLLGDFRRWAPRAGRAGESLRQLLRLGCRNWDVDGEVFIHFTNVDDPIKPFPLAIEIIDADRVSTPPERLMDPAVRMGIERNLTTREVIAYHVRTSQPGDTLDIRYQWTRIEAKAKNGLSNMVHCFEPQFAGQTRGVPLMAAGLNKLKDLHEYDQIVMASEEAGACFAAFVTSITDGEDLARQSATETLPNGKRIQDIEPATLTYLNHGQTVTFGNPNRSGAVLPDYMEYHLRCFAAACDYPYELLTKNWEKLSYSGGRLSLYNGGLAFGCRQDLLAELLLDPLWAHLVLQSMLFGALGVDAIRYRSEPWNYTKVAWIMPAMPSADPLKDSQADSLEVECNFSSLTRKLAARGEDLIEVLDERKFERDELAARELPPEMPLMNRTPPDSEVAGGQAGSNAPAGGGAAKKGADNRTGVKSSPK